MKKGEVTRQRIIEVSAPIFNQRGFAGCSMQDLMEATGLEKGGLYRHFESKEELAVEAFKYALKLTIDARISSAQEVESSAGAIGKLRRMVERFVKVPSPIAGGCPLMNTAVDADDGNPKLRSLARDGVRVWKAKICKIVEDGVAAREIKKGTDPRRIANAIVATLEGSLMISRLEGNREAMANAQETLETMLQALAR
jgi:TetR/AcrR family transcriptional repressor of nem operon